jgi:acyl carrier protein
MSNTEVQAEVISIIRDMQDMYGIEVGDLLRETRLVADLGLSSVTIMHLLASVDMKFQKRLPFMDLVRHGDEYVADLTLGNLVDFVQARLGHEAHVAAM